MKAHILPRYLIGSRQAILELASSRWLLLIGAVFVLSAGLAREYDGEDLLHEPWHAFRPLGASLVTGTILFLIVHCVALMKQRKGTGTPPPFGKAWCTFMGLFWMTAPMAWLYAVPYERFLSPVDAVEVNLWTLAFVAAWRVILMTRVISVLYGIGYVSSFFLVMLFADAITIFVVTQVSTPVIDVMGGIRHSDRDALIAGVTFNLTILSVLTAPIWFIGAMVAAGSCKPEWADPGINTQADRSRGMLVLALISILAFVPLLILSQPEQINRRNTESLFAQGKVESALSLMSDRSQSDFPPQWNPPPRLGYRETSPSLDSIRDAMSTQWPSEWVAELYLAKINRQLREDVGWYWSRYSWTEVVDALHEGYLETITPEHRSTAQFLIDHHPSLDEADRAALEQIVQYTNPSD